MSYKDKAAQAKYMAEWVAKRRREWMEANGPCVQCGSTDRLEVDHIDPTTKVTHKVWSWSQSARDAELAKCQVLCFTCHRTKTHADRYPDPPPHGMPAYRRGCRCGTCRAGNVNRVRRQRGLVQA